MKWTIEEKRATIILPNRLIVKVINYRKTSTYVVSTNVPDDINIWAIDRKREFVSPMFDRKVVPIGWLQGIPKKKWALDEYIKIASSYDTDDWGEGVTSDARNE